MPDHREPTPRHGVDPVNPDDTPLGQAVTAYLAGDLRPLQWLPDDEQDLVRTVGPWLLALRGDHPSPTASTDRPVPGPDQDPIAIALGLVPDHDRALAARRLVEARRRMKLKRSDLVRRLITRGWEVSMQDVDAWERSDTAQPPALVAALADILRTSPVALTAPRAAARPSVWVAVLDDATITGQLDAWAEEAGVDSSVLRLKVEHALAGAFHRNEKAPTVPGLRRVIEVLRRTPHFLDRA
ncbi:hypothetical protein ACVGOW_12920 [Pseudonocardia saturnea]|jgi:hypothetical protein|uniref:hypothetical protein n=1 Tax=Pseudonocardia oceani TaxID=2792013 RepID=UPI001C4A2076|nr:hypothetical protein [Pseudonocardia oceani]MBW0110469.1 hypothetical protein [Pseudonocardia oceani]